jgi:hypothetical protein
MGPVSRALWKKCDVLAANWGGRSLKSGEDVTTGEKIKHTISLVLQSPKKLFSPSRSPLRKRQHIFREDKMENCPVHVLVSI